ncbi:uncharacterized protein [Halyomorpha halys]|uniref:uncharacterized protein n=1 Tax=Halyomorpha halys TaxID=286706 RepID=UPI0006D50FE9|nr:uncharacterized protein LOC106690096 [Halyomorpha halys]
MYFRNLKGIFLHHTLLVLFIKISLGNKNVPCTKTGFCKCEFPNGMGVDLILLKGSHFNISVNDKSNEFLLFNPCNNTNIIVANTTINECIAGASLCLEKHIDNKTELFNLGFLNESDFKWENINIQPEINFHHLNKTSRITLDCGSTETSLEVESILNDHHFELKLISKFACVRTVTDEGHSVFSTFLLIVLILFLFYFVCGFLVLRFIRGARGWEAIPNGEFWKSSFNSIKKMCTYFMSGCRNPEVYDTI